MTLKELVIFCSWCTRQVIQQLKKNGKNLLFRCTDFKKRKHNSSEFHHEHLTTFVRWILRVKYSKPEIGTKQLRPLQPIKSPVKKHKSLFFLTEVAHQAVKELYSLCFTISMIKGKCLVKQLKTKQCLSHYFQTATRTQDINVSLQVLCRMMLHVHVKIHLSKAEARSELKNERREEKGKEF